MWVDSKTLYPWLQVLALYIYIIIYYNSIYSSTDSISLKSSVKEVTGSPEALQPCTFPTACGNKFCYFEPLESPKKSYYSNFVQGGKEKGGKNAFDSVQLDFSFHFKIFQCLFIRYHNSLLVFTSGRKHLCQWDLVP